MNDNLEPIDESIPDYILKDFSLENKWQIIKLWAESGLAVSAVIFILVFALKFYEFANMEINELNLNNLGQSIAQLNNFEP